jgi:phage terminase small subunit
MAGKRKSKRPAGKAKPTAPPAAKPDVAGLTPKQRVFVEEYLVDLNGTQAAIRAGYSTDSARQIASENLSKPYIAEAIDKALADRGGITRTRIVDELARIGFSDIRKVVSWRPEPVEVESLIEGQPPTTILASRVTVLDSGQIDPDTAAAIASVSQGATGALKIQMHDKPAALEKLARALGMFKDRLSLTDAGGNAIVPVINIIGRPGPASPPKAMGGVRDGSD